MSNIEQKETTSTSSQFSLDQIKLPIYLVISMASIFIIMLGIKSTAAIINPILLAVVITIAIMPLPQKMMKHGMSSKVALVLTIIAVLGVILILIVLFSGSIYALSLKLPSYATNIAERSEETSAMFTQPSAISESLSQMDPKDISAIASKLIGIIGGALVQVFMTMLIFIFMLSAAISMPSESNSKVAIGEPLIESIRHFTSDVSQYVTVTTIINLLVGLGDAVMLMILGVDFAILWGLLSWFLGYIPTIGFWLALIPPTILAWAEHGITTGAIVFIGFVLINGSVQNFIQPKMMGDNLNISPIIVFLSLFVWGYLLGAIGAILAVPMTLLLFTILEQFDATRGFVKLLRPASKDDEERIQAKKKIGGWLSKAKSTITRGISKNSNKNSGSVDQTQKNSENK